MSRLSAVLVLALAACGGSTSSTSGSIDAACGDLAQARCDKTMSCTNGAGISRNWGDISTCLTREKLACNFQLGVAGSGGTAALAEACVAAFSGIACADYLDSNLPSTCVFPGKAANGAACSAASQCASNFCNDNKTAICGTCSDPPAAGASCAASLCGKDQSCVAASTLCQAFGAAGAACDTSNPCAADLSCTGLTTTTMGTCQTAVATLGAACGGATLAGCDATMGLVCAGAVGSKTCSAITYGADGAACGPTPTGFASCAGGGDCYTSTGLATGSTTGTCKAPAADGAACDTVVGPPCLTPARCVVSGTATAGTCTVPTDAKCG